MATVLTKAVTREVPRPNGDRAYMVTLKPGGIISIREKGKRTSYEVSVEAVWWLGAKAAAQELRAERQVRRISRKVNRGILHL